MAQLGGVPGLAAKPLQRVRLLSHVGIEDFQRNDAAEILVGRLVNRAHAARGDVRQHLVFAEACTRAE